MTQDPPLRGRRNLAHLVAHLAGLAVLSRTSLVSQTALARTPAEHAALRPTARPETPPGHAPPGPAFPGNVTLLVAGPADGELDQWAKLIGPHLARTLPPGVQLHPKAVGGADGVTGANQFEALTAPDGGAALLVPGSAAIAWLVGEPRAQFDAARWVPAMSGLTSGVIASRLPLSQILSGQTVIIGAETPVGCDLPALLALDLLKVNATRMFGLKQAGSAQDVIALGANMVFLQGRRVQDRVREMAAAGMLPVLAMGVPGEDGSTARDPVFANLPTVPELLSRLRVSAPAPLQAAWRAASAASQLDLALVLPQLTPASMVALWRHACGQLITVPEVQAQAATLGIRLLAAQPARVSTAAVAADTPALLALRRWLAERLDWRPA